MRAKEFRVPDDVRLPAMNEAAGEHGANGRMSKDSSSENLAPGLYLVATPIGNLEDITLRALRVLKQADLIACEDTRHTQKLLNHYAIKTRTISYHEHNEATRAAELVKRLLEGARIALVTDAGMPGISDPGFRLISLAIENGLLVVPIPGASAFLAALVASGLPTDSFRFNGFLPAKRGERRAALEVLKSSSYTQVFYEAPHRLIDSLTDVVEVLGVARHVVIAREVTKLHEEFLRGTIAAVRTELASRDRIRGEITLLVQAPARSNTAEPSASASISERVMRMQSEANVDEKEALKRLARELGRSKSELYRELQRERASQLKRAR